MNRGYSPLDDYDRESDYWRDMEDAIPKEKSPLPAATDKEQFKDIDKNSIARNSENIHVEVE